MSSILSCVIRDQRKIGYLHDGLPDTKDPSYPDWIVNNCCVII